jgi:hypothetical protein
MQKITFQVTFDVEEVTSQNSQDVRRRYLTKNLLDGLKGFAIEKVDGNPFIHKAEVTIGR